MIIKWRYTISNCNFHNEIQAKCKKYETSWVDDSFWFSLFTVTNNLINCYYFTFLFEWENIKQMMINKNCSISINVHTEYINNEQTIRYLCCERRALDWHSILNTKFPFSLLYLQACKTFNANVLSLSNAIVTKNRWGTTSATIRCSHANGIAISAASSTCESIPTATPCSAAGPANAATAVPASASVPVVFQCATLSERSASAHQWHSEIINCTKTLLGHLWREWRGADISPELSSKSICWRTSIGYTAAFAVGRWQRLCSGGVHMGSARTETRSGMLKVFSLYSSCRLRRPFVWLMTISRASL